MYVYTHHVYTIYCIEFTDKILHFKTKLLIVSLIEPKFININTNTNSYMYE